MAMLMKGLERYVRIAKVPMDFGTGQLLNPSEVHMLSTICMHDDVSVTDLAKMNGVTKGAVSQTIAKLEKKGLVYRETSPENQSRQYIRQTEAGQETHEGHMNFHEEHDREFINYMTSLSERDYQTVSEFCKQFHDWMHTYKV